MEERHLGAVAESLEDGSAINSQTFRRPVQGVPPKEPHPFPMVAFDVPSDTHFAALKELLVRGRDDGWWHFEVGSATDEFWNA
ncbi:DUF4265 domain-containing protein [Streptomyces sp. V4I2]|uniref:DUF4265 domain-containing protein n=1 Tax=Streptomyces sp. V4I2 TaxID=3042280 RepID=UPI002786D542|nr:DUF4265 domain-containing protein [Streptomyces sp. V4I2]MDQ1051678.1 hypothetical protein [Streptomyces sp. V4I2]